MRSRLTDLGVAAIPFGFGLLGPGAHGIGWSLPLCVAMTVTLFWWRRSPFAVLAVCFALGLTQVTGALVAGPTASTLPGLYDLGLMGVVAGVAFGLGFGWATGRAFLRNDGGPVSYPALEIIGYIVLSAIAALVASVIPARRAARLAVIEGLAADLSGPAQPGG